VKIPDTSARTCNQCLLSKDHPDFTPECSATTDHKHRLRPMDIWAGVLLASTFDIRSEKTAIRFFGESCFDDGAYACARRLTAEEVAALRTGGSLELRVVQKEFR
jgi:hypothetical protein